MNRTLHLRQALPEDATRILEIEISCFGEDAFTRRQVRYLISRAKGLCLVVACGKDIAGCMSVLTNNRHSNARIYSIAIATGYRRRGLAGFLVDRAVDFARQAGLASVSLEVRVDNTAALALYKKKGFTALSVKQAYYHDGTNACRMALSIGTAGTVRHILS